MVRGKTGKFFLSAYQNDGTTPQDLTGSILWFHVDVGGLELEYYSPSNGITITVMAGGADCATLQIEPADTDAIPEGGLFQGPWELILQNGSEYYPLASGSLTVYPNVGTP